MACDLLDPPLSRFYGFTHCLPIYLPVTILPKNGPLVLYKAVVEGAPSKMK